MTTPSPPQHTLKMSGLNVSFPFKPYPAQLALMDRVLKAVTQKSHALLESPTGSGKTLALLCSVLAWQKQLKQELSLKAQQQAQEQLQLQPHDIAGASVVIDEELRPYDAFASAAAASSTTSAGTSAFNSSHFPPSTPATSFQFTQGTSGASVNPSVAASRRNEEKEKKKALQTPKVYFASRTHSQLTQIVSELKTTIYRPTMSILGSRQHYCIHPEVSQSTNKSEDCQKLLDFGECRFHRQVFRLINKPEIQPGGKSEVWDIEDFVTLGERSGGCPYFAARQIAELPTTDFILCPYNYLIDPLICKAMNINLQDSVVVIDEAHNIEDTARGAASRELDIINIQVAEKEMTRMMETFLDGNERLPHFMAVRAFLSKLVLWMQDKIATMSNKSNSSRTNSESDDFILSGDECLKVLSEIGVTPANLKTLLKSMDTVCTKPADADKQEPHVNGVGVTVIESLALVWEFMLGNNLKYLRDYRMVLKREQIFNQTTSSGMRSRSESTHLLCFWCLNPAVAFSKLATSARSVILTSGTLSPMDSFASELGLPFNIRLEAPHVIDRSQLLAHVVSRGPSGVRMNAQFKHTEDTLFQDELGAVIEAICQRTPAGILVFFPSYSLLEKVTTRWRETHFWQDLNRVKQVILEPKGSGVKFEAAMKKFQDANTPPSQTQEGKSKKRASRSRRKLDRDEDMDMGENQENEFDGFSSSAASPTPFSQSQSSTRSALPKFLPKSTTHASQTGGLFLAVNRGKISEGIDFADYQARAVIVVGIPFPNVKDSQVVLKRQHNDQQKRAANDALLTGSQWYALQAYRSVNQAVGRTIRHRYDYGAIYLIDERYRDAKVQSSLSKWIQPSLLAAPVPFQAVLEQTEQFFQKWTTNPPGPPPSTTPLINTADQTFNPNDFINTGASSANQKTMSHFFHQSTAAGSTIPASSSSHAISPVPSIFASNSTSMKYEEIIDDEDELEVIPLPPLPSKSAQPSSGSRSKIEIAYQSDSDDRPRTSASVPSSSTPTHLALSCKQCLNPLASLPIVQPVTNAPPYHQVITNSYFVDTVASVRNQLRDPACTIHDQPSQVQALVSSAFTFEPVTEPDGIFGWIGYPCMVPAGLPVPSQFYNIWVEQDETCYQPLCCSSCHLFVGVQILADRRDLTPSQSFEEGCWIANDLIRIAPMTKSGQSPQLPAVASVKPTPTESKRTSPLNVNKRSLEPIPLDDIPESSSVLDSSFISPEPKPITRRVPTPHSSSSPPIPLSMPTLESRQEIEAHALDRNDMVDITVPAPNLESTRGISPSAGASILPVPSAASLADRIPSPSPPPPPLPPLRPSKKRVSAADAIAALSNSITSSSVAPPSTDYQPLTEQKDYSNLISNESSATVSPPLKKQKHSSPAPISAPSSSTTASSKFSGAVVPPLMRKKSPAIPIRECIDIDAMDEVDEMDDFLSSPVDGPKAITSTPAIQPQTSRPPVSTAGFTRSKPVIGGFTKKSSKRSFV